MPNPTPGALHNDDYLTDVSVAYVQSAENFVAGRIFPSHPVAKQSDKIAIYSQADFLRDEAQKRGPGDSAVQVGYRTSSTSYICDEWAMEHPIDDQVRANADAVFADPEEAATVMLTQKMLIKREVEFITNFFTTGNLWTGSSDGADVIGATDFTQFSNVASEPIEVFNTQMLRVEAQTGFRPNKLLVGAYTWTDLKNHPDVVDRVKYTSGGPVSKEAIAALIGVDEILVASAVRNTAAEGLSHTGSYIAGGDDALLVYTSPTPSLMMPTAGLTLNWTGLIGSADGQVIERYRDEKRVSDVVRLRAAWAYKRVAPALGVFFNDCSTKV